MKRSVETFWATLGEGSLILVLAAIAWAVQQPLIFASLGPTAYELVEQPQLRSARTYNVIVGHLVGIGSGFLAVYLFSAWTAPSVLFAFTLRRGGAAVFAATLTTLVNLVLRASQPAALATTLLVSLGVMQSGRDAASMIVGVLIIAAIGQPMRHFRLKYTEPRPGPISPG
ncbi:MAG TPA: HPP family protein [Candidatus Acidoferrum sp.]|nr:HPP family protein [Candidatus Acidoferrum sp.]